MNLWFTLCLHFAGYDEGIHTIAEQNIVLTCLWTVNIETFDAVARPEISKWVK